MKTSDNSTSPTLPPLESRSRLHELARQTSRILFQAKNVFPFDLFPDTITIDENKTTIIHREFFTVKRMYTVLHQDIIGVKVFTSLFFASLSIDIQGPESNPTVLRHMTWRDAIYARRLILGLSTAAKQKINFSLIPTDELVKTVEEIGKSFEHPQIK
jgi:hypothetical protein